MNSKQSPSYQLFPEAKIIKKGDIMFQPFLTLFVYSLPCINFFLSLKSSISIYFKRLKHFWLFLELFENEDRLSEKKMYLYYPVPVPQHTCIRPQLICGSIERERSSYLSCWIYINSQDNFIDVKFTLIKYVFFNKCLSVNVSENDRNKNIDLHSLCCRPVSLNGQTVLM